MSKPQYGAAHRRRRAKLLPKALGTPCPGCGRRMVKGMLLDAAHSTDVVVDPKAQADHILCARCNRSDGGRVGSRRARFRPSRAW